MMTGDAIDNIRVSGYDIIAEIGHGNNGNVYYAIQLRLKRPVALKILSEDLANDQSYVNAFITKLKLQLNYHTQMLSEPMMSGMLIQITFIFPWSLSRERIFLLL